MATRYQYEELMLLRILELHQLAPHYWSELILYSKQLLDEQERQELDERIFEVEKMVLETEVIPKELPNGEIQWVERIKGDLSLYDIEMAIESNPDYYAYFERDDGSTVTKFDIERKLNRIKEWIYSLVREKSKGRRFQRFR